MTAIVFGGTGLVGSQVIEILLKDDYYTKVISMGRTSLGIQHKKLKENIINFDELNKVNIETNVDHVFLCLGTTMAKAGSKANFYKIDYTYTVEAARWAKMNGAKKIGIVSAIGASVSSWIYYSKVKGETERDLISLDFESTIIIRPSLLIGDRKEYRRGEIMAERMSQYFGFLYIGPMSKYKPVRAKNVAFRLIENTKTTSNKVVFIESQNI